LFNLFPHSTEASNHLIIFAALETAFQMIYTTAVMLTLESPIVFLCISSVWTTPTSSFMISLIHSAYYIKLMFSAGTLFKSKTHSFMFLYLTLTTVTACIILLFFAFMIINYNLV